ncbi:MAG TPA: YraN family protein, partial [Spirochaetales bacterium]|nr:YraN family protein [Spirochaetales bacterium]
FVEVKAVDAWGPETLARTVGAEKRRRIVETSKLFMLTYREFSCMTVRYDVIAVKANQVELYLERAFTEHT